MGLRSYNGIISQRIASQSAATADTADTAVLQEGDMAAVVVKLNVTTVSVTGGTLDVYIQTSPDGGTTWIDAAHFAQISASTANAHFAIVPVAGGAGAVKGAVGAKTVSASNLGVPLLGRFIKVVGVVATAAFTFTVDVYYHHVERQGA
ncbi:MAG: hypothetical protein M1275_03285 [Patescibacteria group bacterium]|nr:hypothetical protein [Patescibacteria group bacterium]